MIKIGKGELMIGRSEDWRIGELTTIQCRWASGGLLLIWMTVIFCFSAQAHSNELTKEIFGGLNYFVRKGSHMTEYAILYTLAHSFQSSLKGISLADRVLAKSAFRMSVPLLFAFIYAMSDEWHQSFVPGRSALFSDVLIDSCGAAIAASLFAFANWRNSTKT